MAEPAKKAAGAAKSRGESTAKGAAAGSGAAPSPSKPKRRRVEVGGHVMYVDPEPPTPDPIDTCSICGQVLVDGECPDHKADEGGWAAVVDERTPREIELAAKKKAEG